MAADQPDAAMPGVISAVRRQTRNGAMAEGGYLEAQRLRLLRAMTDVVSQRGYPTTSPAHVASAAHVSRATFYEYFGGVEDCFCAALDEALRDLADVAGSASTTEGLWHQQMRAALEAILGYLEVRRAVAWLVFVEVPRAGPVALKQRAHAMKAVLGAIEEGSVNCASGPPVPELTAPALVGGAMAVIQAELIQSRSARLLPLANPLMAVLVQPYLGPAAAAAQMNYPVPRAPERAGTATREDSSVANGAAIRPLRMTYRTHRVLLAISETPGARNCDVAAAADIVDQGQVSKLLSRLQRLGLIRNIGHSERWAPNNWLLTPQGAALVRSPHV